MQRAGRKQHPSHRSRRRGGSGAEGAGGHRLLSTCSIPAGTAPAGLPLPEGGEEAGADAHVGAREAGARICVPGKIPQHRTAS